MHDGVGKVGLAAVLQARQELRVQPIEIRLFVVAAVTEVWRNETKCGDAGGLSKSLELRPTPDLFKQFPGQRDIRSYRLNVAGSTDLLECEPDLESSKPTGVLGSKIEDCRSRIRARN
jgi:hypothetical protein